MSNKIEIRNAEMLTEMQALDFLLTNELIFRASKQNTSKNVNLRLPANDLSEDEINLLITEYLCAGWDRVTTKVIGNIRHYYFEYQDNQS